MTKPTYLSYFAGGDLAGVGLQAAGYAPDTLVELDPAIAEVAAANHPDARVLVADVTTVDPRRFERPDLLWASPECKEFSAAKTAGAEGPVQLAQARAICDALTVLTPPTFVLENVTDFRRSRSLAMIRATLDRLGYLHSAVNVVAADFGVPQTRRRLILRAVRGGLVPTLPAPVPWVGWHAAIADLLDTLPPSRFAAWQLARLPETLAGSAFFAANDSRNAANESYGRCSWREESDPAFTVTHNSPGWWKAFLVHPNDRRTMPVVGDNDPAFTVMCADKGMPRAFLVSGQSVNGGPPSIRNGDAPSMTVGTNADRSRAFIVDGQYNGENDAAGRKVRGLTVRESAHPMFTVTSSSTKHPPRAWLDGGRVVAMTARALARFQSVPDSYQLPEAKGLAARIIGNGVPPLLAQRIGEAFLRRGGAM